MLGYVRTNEAELRVREARYYRALYCGLCKRMGKCTGNCSRLALSYDFVFLAAVRISITGEKPKLYDGRCMLHPWRRRPMVAKCDALDFCADASALLCYHKILDDLQDEKGFRRLRAAVLRLFFGRAYRRSAHRHPALDRVISEQLRAISRVETGQDPFVGADAIAAQFGELMRAVFAYGLEGSDARIASAIGRSIGHWIYLADAADDLEEDRKKGRFNPFVKLFGEELTEENRESLRQAMTVHLCEAERAFLLMDRCPSPELEQIISNILYLGLPTTLDRILQEIPTNSQNTER